MSQASAPDVDADTATADDEDAGDPNSILSNYTAECAPRELTAAEIDAGHRETGDENDRAYFAIKREHGYVGGLTGNHDKLPRVRVLYASRDGRRSFTRMFRATDDVPEGEEFRVEGQLLVEAFNSHTAGIATAKKSIHGFRDLVNDLHGGDI